MVRKKSNFEEFIYCHCGCGKTRAKYNWDNKPGRYIQGHNALVKGKTKHNKGGLITNYGYRRIYRSSHYSADSKGYVLEHKYIFEKYYNCCLLPWVDIHHINGIRTDNRLENLKPLSHGEHSSLSNSKKIKLVE